MTSASLILVIALFCSVSCNPLGQTTVCDTMPNFINPVVPTIGETTVCSSSPNLGLGALGLGYPYGYGLGLPYGLGHAPWGVPAHPLSLAGAYNPLGATTVCESAPNVFTPVLGLAGLGLGLPIGATTVCDTVPNVGFNLPYAGLGPVGTTTVCDSVPNLFGYGLGYPTLPTYPMGLGLNALGSTTVCDSTPNVLGLGLRPFL